MPEGPDSAAEERGVAEAQDPREPGDEESTPPNLFAEGAYRADGHRDQQGGDSPDEDRDRRRGRRCAELAGYLGNRPFIIESAQPGRPDRAIGDAAIGHG